MKNILNKQTFLLYFLGLLLFSSTTIMAQDAPDLSDSTEVDKSDTAKVEETAPLPDFVPIPDRWRDIVPPLYEVNVISKKYDPYHRNILKGDYPIIGDDIFLILTGTSISLGEYNKAPTPSGISTAEPNSQDFFGDPTRVLMFENLRFTFELYKGQTAFMPREWEIKITPELSLNYLKLKENNGVNINPRKGTTRSDNHLGFQELSIEKHLFNISDRYDFVSFKAGIQKFGSDFRGFVFNDYNLGYRLFGNYDGNKYQYNFIYMDLIEKETNSELNLVFDERKQEVFIANLYKQDFKRLGYTAQLSFHYNHDKANFHFDENGRPVRPAVTGFVIPHEIKSYYLGFAGDGHFGIYNVSHAFYQVFGTDSYNQLAGQAVDINAQMAAFELSVDRDWKRYKISVFYASGDANPMDDKARAFDAIIDQPFFAGGPFSYWQQQVIGLQGVALVHKFSFLPSLRSNKLEGQANYVNPGLLLVNVGFDAEWTPKLKSVINVNYLSFINTRTLQHFLNQDNIGKGIGLDYSLGIIYRPFLNNNAIFSFGVAGLTPFKGFEDIYETSNTQFSLFTSLIFTY